MTEVYRLIPQYEEIMGGLGDFFQGLKNVKKTLEYFNTSLAVVKDLNSQTQRSHAGLLESSLELSSLIQQTKSSIVTQLDQIHSQLA